MKPDKGAIVYISRTTLTPEGMPRGEFSSFVENLKNAGAVLEFQPTVESYGKIVSLTKPGFKTLSNDRLLKLFEITAHDLFLLDQLLATIDAPDQIDGVRPEQLFEDTLKRYFGGATVYRPGFSNLAALAQFNIAPLVSTLPNIEREDPQAAHQLFVLADRPPRYFFQHSSAAELVARALAWNSGFTDYSAFTVPYLIEYFKNREPNDQSIARELGELLRNGLKLKGDEIEEYRLKSRFLANDDIFRLVGGGFPQLSLNTIARCIMLAKDADNATFDRYHGLVDMRIIDGTVSELILTQQSSQFLKFVRHDYPSWYSELKTQFAKEGLRTVIQTGDVRRVLRALAAFAEPDDCVLADALDSISDTEVEEMIQRTVGSASPISNIHWSLRELKDVNPSLLERWEEKLGAARHVALLIRVGDIVDLFHTVEYSSPFMTAALIKRLENDDLDKLTSNAINTTTSISNLGWALRHLKDTDVDSLELLEQKVGAKRYLLLLRSNGKMFELFRLIQYSTLSMAENLIRALDANLLDLLVSRTIATGQSIGTLSFTLRKLKKSNEHLLKRLERAIGAERWWLLISLNGHIGNIVQIMEYMDNPFRREMASRSHYLSISDWESMMLRGDLSDLALFVQWTERYFSEQFTPGFLISLKSTFVELVGLADMDILRQSSARLWKAPDSQTKEYLLALLEERLMRIDISSSHFESFHEGVHWINLLWQLVPSKRDELAQNLFKILPEQNAWLSDREFVNTSRLVFLILTSERFDQNDARQVLALGSGQGIAALLPEVTTLNVFLYIWNLYCLWFQLQVKSPVHQAQSFGTILNLNIKTSLASILNNRFQNKVAQNELDNLIALAGLMHVTHLATFSPSQRESWIPKQIGLSEKLLGSALRNQSFVYTAFLLTGIELINGAVPEHAWAQVLSKSEIYTERTAGLNKLIQHVKSRAAGSNQELAL